MGLRANDRKVCRRREGRVTIDRRTLDKLLEIVGGNQDDVIEIVSSFLEEGPALMAALQTAAGTSNLDVLRRSAHSLKSNARDMGAFDLAATCARIESLAAGGAAPPLAEVKRAAAELEDATGELRRLYNLGGCA